MTVRPIPEGFHTVTPYFVVQGASRLVEFLKQAFDGEELDRATASDGTVQNARVRIGDSIVMVGEARKDSTPMQASIYLYIGDTDAVYKRSLEAGASSLMEPADQFYGDRNAGVKDAFGNHWWLATHIEDVSPDEMKRRIESFMKSG